MEKTIFTPNSSIVVGITLCIIGIGMLGFFYFSGNQTQHPASEQDLAALSAPKSNTVQITSYSLIKNPTNLPLKLMVLGNDYKKTKTVSYNELISVSWIPFLVLGSYILVHSRFGIESKAYI